MTRSTVSAVALAATLAACTSADSAPLAPAKPAAGPAPGFFAEEAGAGMARSDDATASLQLGDLPADRHLVRTGRLSIVVDAWDPFARDLDSWLDAHGGFVADTDLTRHEGDVGYATLRVRVPADQLDTLVGWTREKVELQHVSITSSDVTAQWVDQEARLDALEHTEARLLQLMAEQTGTLADVLAAERELSRIRADIESLERQHRALKDQVHLASLHLDVRVRDPLTSPVSRTLGQEAADALDTSLGLMQSLGRGLVILAAAAAPWLALAMLPLLLLGLGVRWLVKRS